MADIFKTYKQRQLKSKEDTFDITQTLFQQVNNEYWRQKTNLWTIISAACNDAASKFYVKLKEYVKNLADIDVCTIHNLKSIAQSVDAKHLLDFTYNLQTFPVELKELMDILSIKPSKLLEADQKLHYSALLPLLGNIDMRSCLIRPQELSLTLLIDIFDNLEKIEKWFKYNRILPNHIIRYIYNQNKNNAFSDQFLAEAKMYNEGLEDDSTVWYYGYNDKIDAEKEGWHQIVYTTLDEVLNFTVEDVLNNIKYIKQLIDQNESNLNKGTQLAQLLGFEFKFDEQAKNIKQYIVNTFDTNSIVVYKNGKYIFNPFFALIEIVKAKVYASQISPFLSYYKEQGDNEVLIDMGNLCQSMIEVIKNNDKCYIRNFMFFHIYHLLYSKIFNEKLKDEFVINVKVQNNQTNKVSDENAQDITNWNAQTLIDINKITYNSKYSELTYDQFYPQVSAWISNNELKEFLGQKIDQDTLDITNFQQIEVANKVEVSHYKKEYIDFIQYLSLVRAITRANNEQRQLPYLIYRYNNYVNDKTALFNQYKRNLLGINEDGTYNSDNYIQKVAEYLTDICIKISYIRQEIKGLVQQYSFIGTERIVTDVVRDYFVKNFAKRSSWRYVSDLFKNRDNTNIIKSIDTLNGLNGGKQFKAQLVEYFDQTAYLNIQTDLPATINGYTEVLTTFPSTYIVTEETLSSWILDEDKLSTIYDNLGFEIPSSLYPSPSIVTSFTQPGVTISGTSLYSDLIAYSAAGVDKSNVSTLDVTDSYVTTADPDEQNSYEFIQTYPQSTAIPANQAKTLLYNHIINTMGQDMLESVSGGLTNIEVRTEVDDGIRYYFVTADIEKTTFKTVTSSVTTTNQSISTPPLDNSNVLSTLNFTASNPLVLSPEKTITGQFYNPAQSAFIIPSGTPVSTILQPGDEVTINVISTITVANWVDGNDLVEKSNPRFWQKNIEYLGWADLSTEISFYQKYFPELQNAPTEAMKIEVYKDKVYPLLTEIWDTNATSGMLDGQNDDIHQQYTGQYPGRQLERNVGNQDFTTMAPLPYIPNLIPVNEYQNDDSYVVKPLYDNISYYMNMFMVQMFNMYKIQAENGFAIAVDGWKNTHIELKGYCSKYERSANTLATQGQMNSKLDYDGPWVYSSLKDFLGLKKNGQISKEDIDWYVDNYFFNVERGSNNIKNKLFRFQQEIFDRGENWKLYSFEFDVNDNQYTLFKRKDYSKYEDAGQIWIRMKNFPLSMPLMNRNVVIEFKDIKYVNDPYDTLLCNQRPNYANMLKQMTNNAVQFGVVKNTMWILGWTNYSMNSSQRLTFDSVDKMLRLISFNFKIREDFTLIVDQLSFQSYSLTPQNDKLNNFNEFVGVNYRQKDDTIDFILYDKDKDKVIVYNITDPSTPINGEGFTISANDVALQIQQIEVLKNTEELPSSLTLGQTYIINRLNNNKINVGTVYYNRGKYIISGYSGQKENRNYPIYTQSLTGAVSGFEYIISSAEFPTALSSQINLIEFNKDYKNQVYDSPFSALYKLPSTAYSILPYVSFQSLANFNTDANYFNQDLFEAQTTISSYANVWRVNADQNNTGIAYQSYDFSGKEDMSSLFLIRKETVQNQKTLKNVFTISSNLITKQVVDSSNNVIYMNQIESISTALSTVNVYLEDGSVNDYITIQQMFPYCHLTRDNKLVISSLITTLGNYKSLTVDKEEKNVYQNPNGWQLLTSTIDPDVVCDDSFEDIITNINSYFYRDGQRIELDDQIEGYRDLFPELTGTYDFYQFYDKYIEAKNNNQPLSTQKEYLQMYNEQMAKLNNVVAFAPVVNEFIIEPLKIIFNFGNIFGVDIEKVNPNKTNYFDLDINTYIDTPEEKSKRVGWKAGLYQTDYINWITRDQRFGSPEIVIVDIEKYKSNNINSYKMNLKDYSIDIIVNACWFAESQIQSLNPNIFVNWKGFTYQYMIEDIETNQDICNFPFIKIRVGLNNNTLRCYRKVLLPVCLFNKHNSEKLFGFIRVWQDEKFDGYVRTSYSTDDWQIKIALTDDTTFRNYQQFEIACDNEQKALRMLNLVGIYGDQQANKLKESLNWNKTLILNVNDRQLQFHIKKIII